jgi:hypothetical protein
VSRGQLVSLYDEIDNENGKQQAPQRKKAGQNIDRFKGLTGNAHMGEHKEGKQHGQNQDVIYRPRFAEKT